MNEQEFITMVKQHRNLIYKVCYSYCADAADRKDLEQEILIALWNAMKKFDGRVKVSTWMYRVALNTAISFYRSGRKMRASQQPLDHSVIDYVHEEYDPLHEEQVLKLYEFIGRLGDLDKALVLLYLDNKKHREISEIMGIPETNVSTRMVRVKEKLRKQFNVSNNE